MSEFEKWEGHHSPGEYAYQTWKEGWRAALRWAKAMHSVSSEPRFDLNISKELGETE